MSSNPYSPPVSQLAESSTAEIADAPLGLNIDITITKEDYREFQQFWRTAVGRRSPSGIVIISILGFAIITFALANLVIQIHLPTAAWMGLIVLAAVVLFKYDRAQAQNVLEVADVGMALGEMNYRIGEQGLQVKAQNFETRLDWSAANSVAESDTLIIIVINAVSGFMVPKRYVVEPQTLVRAIRLRIKRAAENNVGA